MVADSDQVENAEKKQSWFQTLPGLLTATTALVTAIGGIIALVVSRQPPPPPPTPPSSAPVTTAPVMAPQSSATVTTPSVTTPPTSTGTISLPGADWQGWLDEPAARCRAKDRAVAIGRTDQGTMLVVCSADSGDLYYKAVTSDGRAIELPDAKRNEDGFDVTTDAGGNIFLRQIRKEKLTILENGKVISSEQFRGYASS